MFHSCFHFNKFQYFIKAYEIKYRNKNITLKLLIKIRNDRKILKRLTFIMKIQQDYHKRAIDLKNTEKK